MESSPASTPKPSSSPDPPRAFAQGVGVVLQGVGVVLFLSNCCLCSLAGLWDPNLSSSQARQVIAQQPQVLTQPGHYLRDHGRGGVAVTLLAATVGGLALAALGLGLQADRPRPAYGAALVHTVLVLILIGTGALIWTAGVHGALRLWHGVMLLILALSLPFTWAALVQVVRHPPPPVDDTLPPGLDIRDVLAGEKPSRMKVAELRARLEVQQRELERLERELKNPSS